MDIYTGKPSMPPSKPGLVHEPNMQLSLTAHPETGRIALIFPKHLKEVHLLPDAAIAIAKDMIILAEEVKKNATQP